MAWRIVDSLKLNRLKNAPKLVIVVIIIVFVIVVVTAVVVVVVGIVIAIIVTVDSGCTAFASTKQIFAHQKMQRCVSVHSDIVCFDCLFL